MKDEDKEKIKAGMRWITWSMYCTYGLGKYANYLIMKTKEITRSDVIDALKDPVVADKAAEKVQALKDQINELEGMIKEAQK